MVLWKKFIVCFIICIFLGLFVSKSEGAPNSLIPIIETSDSSIEVSVGEAFNLNYIIIDDNPSHYTLRRNGQLLERNSIESSMYSFTRTESSGDYTFSLRVTDFSNNYAIQHVNVTVHGAPTTSAPATTTATTKTITTELTSSEEGGAPGFDIITILGALSLVYLIYRKRR